VAERLGRAAVVTACVQAANVWSSSAGSVGQRWQRVAELHGRVALAHLAYAGQGLPLVRFVDGLTGPLGALLPDPLREVCDDISLVEGDQLSSPAFDLLRENLAPSVTAAQVAEWAWESLSAEKIQGWLYGRLLATGTQAGYEAARLTVIRHAAGPLVAVNDLVKQVGLPRDGLYEPIPAWAWVGRGAERYWFGCLVCGWPMRFQLDRVSCLYPPHVEAVGSMAVRFPRSGPPELAGWRRPRLANLVVPVEVAAQARPVEEHVSLVRPVWRYSTIPGLEEWRLTQELRKLTGVDVQLWPHTDAYDLLVEVPRRGWRRQVDLKDYTDPGQLAGVLGRNEALRQADMVIVVPPHRARQVGLLNERLRDSFRQPRRRFVMTTGQFLRLVRAVVARPTGGGEDVTAA
jgi:hypothetical protein